LYSRGHPFFVYQSYSGCVGVAGGDQSLGFSEFLIAFFDKALQ